jgi:hypothetical protein
VTPSLAHGTGQPFVRYKQRQAHPQVLTETRWVITVPNIHSSADERSKWPSSFSHSTVGYTRPMRHPDPTRCDLAPCPKQGVEPVQLVVDGDVAELTVCPPHAAWLRLFADEDPAVVLVDEQLGSQS